MYLKKWAVKKFMMEMSNHLQKVLIKKGNLVIGVIVGKVGGVVGVLI